MKQTRKVIITVTSIAAALLVALVVWYSLAYVVKADYSSLISRGMEYLEAGEYDKAIVEFREAMEMDDQRPEAYINLSKAYGGKGYLLFEQAVLEDGYNLTRNPEIRLLLAERFPDSTLIANEEKKAEKAPEKKAEKETTPDVLFEDRAGGEGVKRELTGIVTDAVTKEPVADVVIKAYVGSSESGNPVKTTSQSDGSYSLMIPSGDCHVVVEKDGFVTSSQDIYVVSQNDQTYQELTISKNLSNEAIRIILTWGEAPKDLDSYLRGNTGSGDHIMTSYSDKQQYDSNGNLVAELDRDELDGYGPETTTLYDMTGSYEFLVVDFNNTGDINRSNAQVQVLRGDSVIETIQINPSAEPMWLVLKINKGEVTVLNEAHSEATNIDNK